MGSIQKEEILNAMEKSEICGYYQPKYDATTGKLVSAEILARWIKSDGTVVPPFEFVPVMEESDDINALDWYMADEACRTIRDLGDRAIPIAVNFSRHHIHESDFNARLSELLKKYDIRPELFEVEITESAMIDENEHIIEWIDQIHKLHIKVAIDDFGSGLSSLQFVKDMPIDVLKIDRSLLSGNCSGEKERIVLESIFYFANRLNLDTIAEGVETEEQLGFLRTCDCKKIQGYLFARPMPKDDFIGLCGQDRLRMTESQDILNLQTPASATQLLLSAVFQKYPLVIFANLTKNSYYMMAYDNFTTTECAATGVFDDLIKHGAETILVGERDVFAKTFSRDNLLKQYKAGAKEVSLITRQLGDDGIYRKVETTDYFVKSPASDDILVISLNTNIQ